MILIAIATAGYTALGGLPASLATDRIQALMVIALLTGLGILAFDSSIWGRNQCLGRSSKGIQSRR